MRNPTTAQGRTAAWTAWSVLALAWACGHPAPAPAGPARGDPDAGTVETGAAPTGGGATRDAGPPPDPPPDRPAADAAEPEPSGDAGPAPSAVPLPPLPEGMREVEVHSAAELMQAITPDTRVVLAPGEYDLTRIWYDGPGGAGYEEPREDDAPPPGTEWVRWTNPYDGWELEIHDVQNLQLVAATAPRPRIVVRPRYAWVLKFEDCSGITLAGLSLGHTEAGYCLGGVLGFEGTTDVALADVDLFGSGTYGIGVTGGRNVRVERTTIRECSYGILQLAETRDVEFRDCVFQDNQEFDLVEVTASRGVLFAGCAFERNRTRDEEYSIFALQRSRVEVRECTFRDNRVGRRSAGQQIEFEGCVFEDNEFLEERPPARPSRAGLAPGM
jgi:hypothetical protein